MNWPKSANKTHITLTPLPLPYLCVDTCSPTGTFLLLELGKMTRTCDPFNPFHPNTMAACLLVVVKMFILFWFSANINLKKLLTTSLHFSVLNGVFFWNWKRLVSFMTAAYLVSLFVGPGYELPYDYTAHEFAYEVVVPLGSKRIIKNTEDVLTSGLKLIEATILFLNVYFLLSCRREESSAGY